MPKLRGKLGPVASDLLAEEHSGELANIGGFSSAKMMNQSWNHLRILRQTLNLLLSLPASVVVRHQELNQQEFKGLSHWEKFVSVGLIASLCRLQGLWFSLQINRGAERREKKNPTAEVAKLQGFAVLSLVFKRLQTLTRFFGGFTTTCRVREETLSELV